MKRNPPKAATPETPRNAHESAPETHAETSVATADVLNDTLYDLAVIGGGPAGMMAAGRAAERGLKVILLEKNDTLGKKLLITGGGRCNVTNAETDTRTLLAKFKDSDKYLFSAFAQHGVTESLDFFHSRKMPTKVEPGKRVFPLSNKAQSVWDVLVNYMKGGKVTVKSDSQVVSCQLSVGRKEITGLKLKDGSFVYAKNFVLATGGKSHPETGSTGDGFAWLKELGHAVSEPRAALVPVKVSDEWVHALSGFSLPEAKITLFQNGAKVPGKQAVKKGKVLFTHFGLSGPAVLNMSSEIDELLKYGEVVLSLDLLPTHDYATLNEALQKLFKKQSNKKFKNALSVLIPAPLVPTILALSGIDEEVPCHSVTREERLALVTLLKGVPIHPTGLLGADKAIITSGGVSLDEIDWKTMRSRLISNLHIVGDLLDIDRPSGGYSLQLCWTTGWVAGNAVGRV
ncbi:MAG: NAD(P)/FAD-dependent oxidoreductase [Candidatus Pacebacteria bacterium]|nr:NAD(P)/FAD-dependent oxidoreductase [Candidatus Paceibacterota bacterium]